ncbi:MAG: NAD-dependent epimerase/dehydratase family protein, partial [Myxococcota bacterium]
MSDRPALLVTGATGLIGSALSARRTILPLPRRAPSEGGPWWEPTAGRVHDLNQSVGAVVHLAGAGVADKRWTADRKQLIMESRRQGTRTLVDWMASRPQRPAVLVSASAIGIYGDRGDAVLDEDADRGAGFLADVVE